MLELRNIHKRYSSIPAVEAVSFTARAVEITGYLGPNGSGKSTTMKMITGLIEPTSGEILFRGARIDRDWIAYKQALGYVPEEPHLYPHLTGTNIWRWSRNCETCLPGSQRRESTACSACSVC